jgi:hypothetical protein
LDPSGPRGFITCDLSERSTSSFQTSGVNHNNNGRASHCCFVFALHYTSTDNEAVCRYLRAAPNACIAVCPTCVYRPQPVSSTFGPSTISFRVIVVVGPSYSRCCKRICKRSVVLLLFCFCAHNFLLFLGFFCSSLTRFCNNKNSIHNKKPS